MSWIRIRNLERIFLLLIAGVLAFLSLKLFDILKLDFENVPKRLARRQYDKLKRRETGGKNAVTLENRILFRGSERYRIRLPGSNTGFC